MKKSLLCFLIPLMITPLIYGDESLSINICTPEWKWYSQKDGKGLYHDLWNKIYRPLNIKINIDYLPYKRCIKKLKETYLFDAVPGEYINDEFLEPKWHIGVDLITVAYKKGKVNKWQGQNTLLNKKVSWMRGYDFDKIEYGVLRVPVNKYEFNYLASAVKMLDKGRIDFLLDYAKEINFEVKKANLEARIVVIPEVLTGPKYFLSFKNREKSRKLLKIWDEGMKRLYLTGELVKMFKEAEDKAWLAFPPVEEPIE
jgi:polar amino acid transport system substrate-binding protein